MALETPALSFRNRPPHSRADTTFSRILPTLLASICATSAAWACTTSSGSPVQSGVIDAARPQALVYEVQNDGKLRLIALEYAALGSEERCQAAAERLNGEIRRARSRTNSPGSRADQWPSWSYRRPGMTIGRRCVRRMQ